MTNRRPEFCRTPEPLALATATQHQRSQQALLGCVQTDGRGAPPLGLPLFCCSPHLRQRHLVVHPQTLAVVQEVAVLISQRLSRHVMPLICSVRLMGPCRSLQQVSLASPKAPRPQLARQQPGLLPLLHSAARPVGHMRVLPLLV